MQGQRAGDFQALLDTQGQILGQMSSKRAEPGIFDERPGLLEGLRLAKGLNRLQEGGIETVPQGDQDVGLYVQIWKGTDDLKGPPDPPTADLVGL